MPRDGSGIYSKPAGTTAVADTTIDSAKYNNNVDDVVNDLNLPRPIVAGGTAATSADAALTSLSAEKAKQIVTNWDSTTWRAGSFYAATSATGAAPVAAHAFAGIAYYANVSDFVCEATDLTDPRHARYVRVMSSGVWGSWAPANIVLKKNYILNSAMMVSQENGTTAGTVAGYYPADQFVLQFNSTGTPTVQQVAVATPAGSSNRIRMTATVADAAITTNKYCNLGQRIEGIRTVDLKFGSASAKTITIQFGVKAPAGTYCVALRNTAANRAYIAEFTIASGEANTDVVKTVTLTGDTTGTWAIDTTVGMEITWALMCGPTYQTPANIWTAGNLLASANQFNFMGTAGNVFELFDVGLYEGTVAPVFQVPDYPSELALCKRYWQRISPDCRFFTTAASTNYSYGYFGGVDMRASPTVATVAGGTFANVTNYTAVQTVSGRFGEMRMTLTSTSSGDTYMFDRMFSLSARL